MSWPATDRYAIQAAPDGLAFVQDMLNTLSAGKPRETDLFLDTGHAQAWLDEEMDPFLDMSVELERGASTEMIAENLTDWLDLLGKWKAFNGVE